jgi:hypothetical protein
MATKRPDDIPRGDAMKRLREIKVLETAIGILGIHCEQRVRGRGVLRNGGSKEGGNPIALQPS